MGAGRAEEAVNPFALDSLRPIPYNRRGQAAVPVGA